MPFNFKHKFLKVSVDLQTALAAEAHLAEGEWLEELQNVEMFRMFRAGTFTPAVY
jgi:hypothetical protein